MEVLKDKMNKPIKNYKKNSGIKWIKEMKVEIKSIKITQTESPET